MELEYGTERRTRLHYATKMRVQYETKGNCTFNSSLALALRYRLDRKVAGTLSDGKIGGVLMFVCMCVKVYCTCFALVP